MRVALALALTTILVGLSGSAAAAPPSFDARAWVLIDARDGSVIAGKAANKHLPIASTTKLMTSYLALHELKPNQMVVAPSYQPSASAEIELGLRPGERMRVRDLLYGLLLPSASDAAETLAVGVSGSVPAFVTAMNRAARRLDLTDTSYANPIGLDAPGQLFERARPRHPGVDPAPQPPLRPDRRHTERDAPQRRPPAYGHQPEHASRKRPLVERRKDWSYPRRRLCAGRLRDPALHDADLGGARHPERVRTGRGHSQAPRIRVLALSPGPAGESRRGDRRLRSSTTAAITCP